MKMANYELSGAENELDELTTILIGWHTASSPDGGLPGNTPISSEIFNPEEIIKGLIEGVQSERRIMLTVGDTQVPVSRFYPGRDGGKYSETREPIEPGKKLILETAIAYTSDAYEPRGPELYVGLFKFMRLSNVAKTLNEGGILSISDIITPPTYR